MKAIKKGQCSEPPAGVWSKTIKQEGATTPHSTLLCNTGPHWAPKSDQVLHHKKGKFFLVVFDQFSSVFVVIQAWHVTFVPKSVAPQLRGQPTTCCLPNATILSPVNLCTKEEDTILKRLKTAKQRKSSLGPTLWEMKRALSKRRLRHHVHKSVS